MVEVGGSVKWIGVGTSGTHQGGTSNGDSRIEGHRVSSCVHLVGHEKTIL